MDYMRIYKQLMIKAKTEFRKKGSGEYFEMHHIVPDFMFENRSRKGPKGHLPGQPNDPENLVMLTMREHLLAHVLLARALRGKRYWAQAASSLFLMLPKEVGKHARQQNSLYIFSKKYAKYKIEGIRGISTARKGTFPAKDSKTGVSVGSVYVDHPKVISGEWVHHSKGNPQIITQKVIDLHRSSVGKGNRNARTIDIDYVKGKMLQFDDVVKCYFDSKFIVAHFRKWFDSLQHDMIFYRFINSNNKLEQKISGMSRKFLDIKKLAIEVNNEHNMGWSFPTHGCAKYNKVAIC